MSCLDCKCIYYITDDLYWLLYFVYICSYLTSSYRSIIKIYSAIFFKIQFSDITVRKQFF